MSFTNQIDIDKKKKYLIEEYFKTLWELDRTNEPALSPHYEHELYEKRDMIETIYFKIVGQSIFSHPYYAELSEASLK